MHIRAYFSRPMDHFRRHGRGVRAKAPKHHIQKPDADNISKFIGDCLSGLAFYDDCQISSLRVVKRWSHGDAHTRIKITYLDRQQFDAVLGRKQE